MLPFLPEKINKYDCLIWNSERPQKVYKIPQETALVVAWCAISEKCVVGPYFSENKLVAEDSFQNILRYCQFLRLENSP